MRDGRVGHGALKFSGHFSSIEDVPDSRRQFRLTDWLLHEIEISLDPALVNDGVARIACHVKNLECWSQLSSLRGEFAAIHSAHHHVGQHKVDANSGMLEKTKCRHGLSRCNYMISEIAQRFDD